MYPKIPWLREISCSNSRIKSITGQQIKNYLSQRPTLSSKPTTTESPRALDSSVSFESLEGYLSKNEISNTLEKTKYMYTVNNKFSSQALTIPSFAEEMEDQVQIELPETDSHFRMTKESFQAAKQAEQGTAASYWSHRLYRGPVVDGTPSRPTVHYCRSSNSTENILKSYFMDCKVIGFDIEWKAEALKFHGPRANVSLIQMASEERIGLFHVALYPHGDTLVSPSLRKIMEDPTVSKVGVSIKSDCTRIKKHLNVECRGLFELSHLFKLVKFSQNKDFSSIDKKLVSLAKQVQEHFYLPLFKGGDIRHSDWSTKLQLHQIIYAAADSYAAIQLYNTLELKRKSLIPTPPRPHHAELNIPIRFIKDDDTFLDIDNAHSKPNKKPSLQGATRQFNGRYPAEQKMEIPEKNSTKLEGIGTKPENKKDLESRQLTKDVVAFDEHSSSILESKSTLPEFKPVIENQEPPVSYKPSISSKSKTENTRLKVCTQYSSLKAVPELPNIPKNNTTYSISRAISFFPKIVTQYVSKYLQ